MAANTMRAKHYQAICRAFKKCLYKAGPTQREVLERLALELADEFAAENPQFNRVIFLSEIGF